jgi:hypothetical protein
MDWLQLIGSYAFPIVACAAIGWFVKYLIDRNREDLKEMQKQHSDETKALREEMSEMNKTLTELVIIMKNKEENKND